MCQNNEEEAKEWLMDHRAYEIKELRELYGGTSVEELDDASLEIYKYVSSSCCSFDLSPLPFPSLLF